MKRKTFKLIFAILTPISIVIAVTIWVVWHNFKDNDTDDKAIQVDTNTIEPSLLCAAWKGDVATVRKLLSSGVNPDSTDDNGICEGRPNRATAISSSGDTPLMRAAGCGHTEVVKLLLEDGADINARDSEGNTAISGAAYYMHADIVDLLLTRGADINVKDMDGNTLLMNAAGNGRLEVVKFLLSKGADVNVQDDNGTTALMFAAGFRHREIMQVLLDHGVNPMLKDKKGRTASVYKRLGYPKEYIRYLM
jgi:uncharacterized protein